MDSQANKQLWQQPRSGLSLVLDNEKSFASSLMYAIAGRDLGMVELMLARRGKHLSAQSHLGTNALKFARRMGDDRIANAIKSSLSRAR